MVRKLSLDIREIIDKEKELSLTHIDAIKIKNSNQFDTIYMAIEETDTSNSIFFPNNKRFSLNNDHFGPLYIPKARDKIDLNIKTLPLYKKIITDYEFNDLKVVD